MDFEGCKDLVGMLESFVELNFVGRRSVCLIKTLDGGFVDDTQDFAPHGRLNVVGSIEASIDGLEEMREYVGIEADRTIDVVEVGMVVVALTMVVAIIDVVY